MPENGKPPGKNEAMPVRKATKAAGIPAKSILLVAKIAFAILAMILSQTSLFLVLFLFLLKKKVKKKPPLILAQIQALPKSCSAMKRLWERSRALPWTSSKSGRMSIQPS